MNTLKVKNLKGGNKVYYFCIDCCSVIKAEVVSADWIKLNDKLYYDLYVRNEGENATPTSFPIVVTSLLWALSTLLSR